MGDLSDEVRLHLAEESAIGSVKTNVTWEIDATICRFSWSCNTPGSALGVSFGQDNLCDNLYSVDYYPIEGINTLSPVEMGEACHDVGDMGNFSTVTFCDDDGRRYMTRHTFAFYIKNITEILGLPMGVRRPGDNYCLLYTSPSPRDLSTSRMPSSA